MTSTITRTPSIGDLARSLRAGETTATELARASLRRIRELDPRLNAFTLVDEDGALRAARLADEELAAGRDRGVLHGIPVAVKDLVDIAGLPTTCGSATGFGGDGPAAEDAAIVVRLRDLGAVIVGKTVLHEFAYGATGDRSVHGPSRNPHDPDRMSGGSSGGSAVAVASGMVPLSIGTDTAGSVRVPAALCGIAGLKPAYEALPSAGVYPLAPSLDHVGLFAATADDVRLAYGALTGSTSEATAAPPTLAWIRAGAVAPTDPRVEARCRQALAGLAPVVLDDLPGWDAEEDLFALFTTVQSREAFGVHEHHLDADRDLIDDEVLARLERGRGITDATYAAAQARRQRWRAVVDDLLGRFEVVALPAVPTVAPRIGERRVGVDGRTLEVRSALLSLTSPWNLTDTPALSVPAGTVDGLPVGVQLVTARGREDLLFQVAHALTPTD
jgi:aspartyl-tRNA(Asn)/glutamyl-tRNA(Gln) amidotransferase subunit A